MSTPIIKPVILVQSVNKISGWVRMRAIWDNGLPCAKGKKSVWRLSYNTRQREYKKSRDHGAAEDGGYDFLLLAAKCKAEYAMAQVANN